MNRFFPLIFFLLLIPACTTAPASQSPAITPSPTPPSVTGATNACGLSPIVKPTMPAVIPGYAELDESTGLHITGKVQDIDLTDYHLMVSGRVRQPLSLSYDELRCLPKVTATPALICKGYFEDFANWSGVSLALILEMAEVEDGAASVVLVSADGYQASLSLEEAARADNFLAYEWEGQPLPILHGFPVRAVIPSQNGYMWVKWLLEIRVE